MNHKFCLRYIKYDYTKQETFFCKVKKFTGDVYVFDSIDQALDFIDSPDYGEISEVVVQDLTMGGNLQLKECYIVLYED